MAIYLTAIIHVASNSYLYSSIADHWQVMAIFYLNSYLHALDMHDIQAGTCLVVLKQKSVFI